MRYHRCSIQSQIARGGRQAQGIARIDLRATAAHAQTAHAGIQGCTCAPSRAIDGSSLRHIQVGITTCVALIVVFNAGARAVVVQSFRRHIQVLFRHQSATCHLHAALGCIQAGIALRRQRGIIQSQCIGVAGCGANSQIALCRDFAGNLHFACRIQGEIISRRSRIAQHAHAHACFRGQNPDTPCVHTAQGAGINGISWRRTCGSSRARDATAGVIPLVRPRCNTQIFGIDRRV